MTWMGRHLAELALESWSRRPLPRTTSMSALHRFRSYRCRDDASAVRPRIFFQNRTSFQVIVIFRRSRPSTATSVSPSASKSTAVPGGGNALTAPRRSCVDRFGCLRGCCANSLASFLEKNFFFPWRLDGVFWGEAAGGGCGRQKTTVSRVRAFDKCVGGSQTAAEERWTVRKASCRVFLHDLVWAWWAWASVSLFP